MQQHRLFIDNKRSLIIKSDSSRIHGVIIFMHVSRKLTLHIPTKKSIKLTIYYGNVLSVIFLAYFDAENYIDFC